MSKEDQLRDIENEELRERIEHQKVLSDIKIVLNTKEGKSFVKYLFKNLEVGNLPPQGLTGELLMESLGFHRAGNSIFKMVAETDPQIAGTILGQIEKERYDQILLDETRQNQRR